jgi:hypothetical protein
LEFAKSVTISIDMIRKNFRMILMLSEKVYGKILRLQEEVKILRRPFIFRGVDYQVKIITDCDQIKRDLEERYEVSL